MCYEPTLHSLHSMLVCSHLTLALPSPSREIRGDEFDGTDMYMCIPVTYIERTVVHAACVGEVLLKFCTLSLN